MPHEVIALGDTRRPTLPGTSDASDLVSVPEVPGPSHVDHEAVPLTSCRDATSASAARGWRGRPPARAGRSGGNRWPTARGGTSPQTRLRSGSTAAWCPPRRVLPLRLRHCAAEEAGHMGTTPYPCEGCGADRFGPFLGIAKVPTRDT